MAAGDHDNDGLSDSREGELGTNPLNADTDGDGLNDLVFDVTGIRFETGAAVPVDASGPPLLSVPIQVTPAPMPVEATLAPAPAPVVVPVPAPVEAHAPVPVPEPLPEASESVLVTETEPLPVPVPRATAPGLVDDGLDDITGMRAQPPTRYAAPSAQERPASAHQATAAPDAEDLAPGAVPGVGPLGVPIGENVGGSLIVGEGPMGVPIGDDPTAGDPTALDSSLKQDQDSFFSGAGDLIEDVLDDIADAIDDLA